MPKPGKTEMPLNVGAMEKYMRGNASAEGEAAYKSTTESKGGTISPERAGYMGPESGPFMCGNCIHFSPGQASEGTCDLVAGGVDQDGHCNLFESANSAEPSETEGEPEAGPPTFGPSA